MIRALGGKKPLSGLFLLTLLLAASAPALAEKRMVIIDQDTSGPGGSNIMSMLALLQSREVDVLGITVVTGNAWRDDEARHALRMLELIGRTDVPVALGAVFPLVRTQEETRLIAPLVGKVAWLGAWGQKLSTLPATPGLVEPPAPAAPLGPWDTPPLVEGEPHIRRRAADRHRARRRARSSFRRTVPGTRGHGR
jgi:purine nucleosidase